MACFVVSAAEAAVVTVLKRHEAQQELQVAHEQIEAHIDEVKIPMSRKLGWLSNMLWGGSALLAFEHVWHGEVTPFFPFLTAMSDPSSMYEMFGEMATAGVGMAALVTIAWAIGCKVVDSAVQRADETQHTEA